MASTVRTLVGRQAQKAHTLRTIERTRRLFAIQKNYGAELNERGIRLLHGALFQCWLDLDEMGLRDQFEYARLGSLPDAA